MWYKSISDKRILYNIVHIVFNLYKLRIKTYYNIIMSCFEYTQ